MTAGGAIEQADATGDDPLVRYLLGDGTAVAGALVVALGIPLLLVGGVIMASIGYARIALPGPSPLMIRYPADPPAQPKQMQLGFKAMY